VLTSLIGSRLLLGPPLLAAQVLSTERLRGLESMILGVRRGKRTVKIKLSFLLTCRAGLQRHLGLKGTLAGMGGSPDAIPVLEKARATPGVALFPIVHGGPCNTEQLRRGRTWNLVDDKHLNRPQP
jgi:hypothetical protein